MGEGTTPIDSPLAQAASAESLILASVTAHNHVRTSAGLFDVSHMLQHRFSGPSTEAFLMSLCPTSLNTLAPFSSSLSVLLNEDGGIVDDMMVTKQSSSEAYYVVTNAGRIKEDKELIREKLKQWNDSHPSEVVRWETLDGWGLLALQGPKAAEVLQGLLKDVDLTALKFGKSVFGQLGAGKVKCHIARGGYTGEDGFEVSQSLLGQPSRSRNRQFEHDHNGMHADACA